MIVETLAEAARDKRTVAVEGAGTKRGWGSIAPPADLTISTRELNALVEHRYGDLTATVQAGATLADVNRALAGHGQWIALDPPFADRATIGGILATNDSGPRRHRFGAPRDQIIGVEIARIPGIVSRAGGIVVKNVAGYDLGRLMTGSFGSLAVIISATFKLYPIPPASRTVIIESTARLSGERIGAIVAALTSSQLTPTAIELETRNGEGPRDGAGTRLLVRFESIEAAAEEQASQAAKLAAPLGAQCDIVRGDAETSLWSGYAQRPWNGAGAVIKVTLLPTELGPMLDWIGEVARDVQWDATGRAGMGVLLLRLGGTAAQQAALVAALRARIPDGRGSAVIVRADDELKRAVDVWGPVGDALGVMRAIKQQFDPDGLLNPGRGPFGI